MIRHAQCQTRIRSRDVGIHSQAMIPSDLLPSHVMQSLQSLAVPGFWQFRGLQKVEPDLFCIAAEIHLGQWLIGDLSVCKSWRILEVWRASIHLLHKWNFWRNNWAVSFTISGLLLFPCLIPRHYFRKQGILFSKCSWEPSPMFSEPLCSAEPFYRTAMPCARHHLWHNALLTITARGRHSSRNISE